MQGIAGCTDDKDSGSGGATDKGPESSDAHAPAADDGPGITSYNDLLGLWQTGCVALEATEEKPEEPSGAAIIGENKTYREGHAFEEGKLKSTIEYFVDQDCKDLQGKLEIESEVVEFAVLSESSGGGDTQAQANIDMRIGEFVYEAFVATDAAAAVLTEYCDGEFRKGQPFRIDDPDFCKFPDAKVEYPTDEDKAAKTESNDESSIEGKILYSSLQIRGGKLFIAMPAASGAPDEGMSHEKRLKDFGPEGLEKNDEK